MTAENDAASSAKKPRGKPFQPGQSGNPAGKPKGARSALYAALDQAAEEAAPQIIEGLVAAAKSGDARAADILFRRAWPERKGRPVQFSAGSLLTPGGLVEAMAGITAAMAAGEMTPDEAAAVSSVLEIHRKAIETESLADRIEVLEKASRAPKRESTP